LPLAIYITYNQQHCLLSNNPPDCPFGPSFLHSLTCLNQKYPNHLPESQRRACLSTSLSQPIYPSIHRSINQPTNQENNQSFYPMVDYMANSLASLLLPLVERRLVPDPVLRLGMRFLLASTLNDCKALRKVLVFVHTLLFSSSWW